MWKPTISSDEIWHSAKGATWKKHKYIRKEGDRYIYKETVNSRKTHKNNLMDRSPSGNAKTLKDLKEDEDREVERSSGKSLSAAIAERKHETETRIASDAITKHANRVLELAKENRRTGSNKNEYKILSESMKLKNSKKKKKLEKALAAGASRNHEKHTKDVERHIDAKHTGDKSSKNAVLNKGIAMKEYENETRAKTVDWKRRYGATKKKGKGGKF